MELTGENVDAVALACLLDRKDLIDGVTAPEWAKVVIGPVHRLAFHPERLEEQRKNVIAMLDQLPDQFKEGWSFLNLVTRKDGVMWTGFHIQAEGLLCLGMALGYAAFMSERETWPLLPGGMPYVMINTAGIPAQKETETDSVQRQDPEPGDGSGAADPGGEGATEPGVHAGQPSNSGAT
jgi:hypothetical protein